MYKKFTTNFDDLISDTTNTSKLNNYKNNIKNLNYTRITVAINSENLKKLKIICLIKQLKFRDVVNTLISDFISKNEVKST
jgi:molybdenum cofactor biosynthesis enzyme MoaA